MRMDEFDSNLCASAGKFDSGRRLRATWLKYAHQPSQVQVLTDDHTDRVRALHQTSQSCRQSCSTTHRRINAIVRTARCPRHSKGCLRSLLQQAGTNVWRPQLGNRATFSVGPPATRAIASITPDVIFPQINVEMKLRWSGGSISRGFTLQTSPGEAR